ncbi:DNA-directed RNA polymerase II subunit GRINL1A-like isoform X2 [Dreissena polymorpha]|uniref:Uncharacterized protein n=1 Tax=Dreissena polymorpha TaxID=45954 RepID=A0A9D4KET0_DREPO|nr:DNA-directed RNA polymerase II subunit GRINL1A-like isoform X2 [Dreissena polymorpha]KAH3838164.1 hypothetical protein DPMN_111571 [Dreissena polymorpha]
MAEAFHPTKDGHIGNVEKLTNIELHDIIRRQEQLIKKRTFLSHLPDKGAKVKEHLDVLKQEQERRNKLQDAAQQTKQNVTNEIDGRDLTEALESLSIRESRDTRTSPPKHQYDIDIENAKRTISQRERFHLNRDLKIEKIADLPEEIKKTKQYMQRNKAAAVSTNKICPKVSHEEESAATPPSYKYGCSRKIELVESLELQRKHKEQHELIQAKMATERLASSLSIKMEIYNPEGVDMSYRSRDALDSDDDTCNADNDDDNADLEVEPT